MEEPAAVATACFAETDEQGSVVAGNLEQGAQIGATHPEDMVVDFFGSPKDVCDAPFRSALRAIKDVSFAPRSIPEQSLGISSCSFSRNVLQTVRTR